MKFNWRQIIIHFIAAFCLMLACHTLACFANIELFSEIRNTDITTQFEEGQMLADIVWFTAVITITGFIGLIISFLISLFISLKNRWGWINPIIVFISIYLLGWFGSTEFTFKLLLSLFEKISRNATLEILTIGILLLLCSLALFFSKKTNSFINYKNAHSDKALP